MFKHFILTRFNLKTDHIPGINKNNQLVQTEEWLERRFFLFENYCLPSIMNQSCKNFIWFVLFCNSTSDRFIKKIRDYELQFPLFKPLFLEPGGLRTIKKKLNEILPDYLGKDDKYIITTRIDNDDAFHKDMVSEVQNIFNCQNDTFISFTYGLQYDIERRVLARMYYENNHFISRVEKISDEIETVITLHHNEINNISAVTYINNKNKPLWLEIIHEGNVVNHLLLSSKPLVVSKTLLSFQLNIKVSLKNTIFAFFKYLKLQVLLAISLLLKKTGYLYPI